MPPRLSRLIGEEGWQRTLLIMFVAQLVSAIGFSNIFPFLPLYVQALGSRTTTFSVEFWAGMVFSAQAVTMMIASPFWGSLADRYGRKLMVQRATYGGAVILLLMGFVRSAEELVLLRAVQGLVTGTVSAANALIAASAPRERTGYAMGVLQVGLWGGVAVGPLIGGLLADSLGYRSTFVLTSLLLFAAGVLVHVGVQEKFAPALDVGERRLGFVSGWRHILAQPGVSLAYLLRFLSHLGRMMIIPVAPLFIQLLLPHTQRVNTFTGLVIGLASAASTASAIYLGRLGDRIGHRQILMVSTLAAAMFYLPQAFVSHAWQLLMLQVLAGAAAGGIIPTLSALLAHYTNPGEEGSVYGLDNSIGAAGRAVAPLAGAAIAVWFGLRLTFAATGLLFLLMTLLALWYLPRPTVGSAQ
jgi:MFS transporter, DHA1 family, multidrug resistance protein